MQSHRSTHVYSIAILAVDSSPVLRWYRASHLFYSCIDGDINRNRNTASMIRRCFQRVPKRERERERGRGRASSCADKCITILLEYRYRYLYVVEHRNRHRYFEKQILRLKKNGWYDRHRAVRKENEAEEASKYWNGGELFLAGVSTAASPSPSSNRFSAAIHKIRQLMPHD